MMAAHRPKGFSRSVPFGSGRFVLDFPLPRVVDCGPSYRKAQAQSLKMVNLHPVINARLRIPGDSAGDALSYCACCP